jgi:hypothetical protein
MPTSTSTAAHRRPTPRRPKNPAGLLEATVLSAEAVDDPKSRDKVKDASLTSPPKKGGLQKRGSFFSRSSIRGSKQTHTFVIKAEFTADRVVHVRRSKKQLEDLRDTIESVCGGEVALPKVSKKWKGFGSASNRKKTQGPVTSLFTGAIFVRWERCAPLALTL